MYRAQGQVGHQSQRERLLSNHHQLPYGRANQYCQDDHSFPQQANVTSSLVPEVQIRLVFFPDFVLTRWSIVKAYYDFSTRRVVYQF